MSDIRQAALDRDPDERFTVYQFFEDGSRDTSGNLPAKNAVETAYHWTHSVSAIAGVTRRVIIIDAGDCTVFEWLYGKGVVFPTQQMREDAQGHRKYTKERK